MSDGDVWAAFVAGCFLSAVIGAFIPNTSVTKKEWEFAESSCTQNGGVDYTRGSGSIRSQEVVCVNKANFIRAKSFE